MSDNLQNSIDRAIKLMGTPTDYENYISIKIKPGQGGCCCLRHCWPRTWSAINEYIVPFGPIEEESDVLIGKNNDKYVLECHESGPEIILYGVISGLIAEAVVGLIKVFLMNLQNEEHKHPGSLKIIKRRHIKCQIEEEEIMEVNLPLTEDVIKKLNFNIKKVINKKRTSPKD